MKLTHTQFRSLKLMLQHRSAGLTWRNFLIQGWRAYAIFFAILLAGIAGFAIGGVTVPAAPIAGYVLGFLQRDVQWIHAQLQVTPLISEITNWDRVEQLVAENEQPKP